MDTHGQQRNVSPHEMYQQYAAAGHVHYQQELANQQYMHHGHGIGGQGVGHDSRHGPQPEMAPRGMPVGYPRQHAVMGMHGHAHAHHEQLANGTRANQNHLHQQHQMMMQHHAAATQRSAHYSPEGQHAPMDHTARQPAPGIPSHPQYQHIPGQQPDQNRTNIQRPPWPSSEARIPTPEEAARMRPPEPAPAPSAIPAEMRENAIRFLSGSFPDMAKLTMFEQRIFDNSPSCDKYREHIQKLKAKLDKHREQQHQSRSMQQNMPAVNQIHQVAETPSQSKPEASTIQPENSTAQLPTIDHTYNNAPSMPSISPHHQAKTVAPPTESAPTGIRSAANNKLVEETKSLFKPVYEVLKHFKSKAETDSNNRQMYDQLQIIVREVMRAFEEIQLDRNSSTGIATLQKHISKFRQIAARYHQHAPAKPIVPVQPATTIDLTERPERKTPPVVSPRAPVAKPAPPREPELQVKAVDLTTQQSSPKAVPDRNTTSSQSVTTPSDNHNRTVTRNSVKQEETKTGTTSTVEGDDESPSPPQAVQEKPKPYKLDICGFMRDLRESRKRPKPSSATSGSLCDMLNAVNKVPMDRSIRLAKRDVTKGSTKSRGIASMLVKREIANFPQTWSTTCTPDQDGLTLAYATKQTIQKLPPVIIRIPQTYPNSRPRVEALESYSESNMTKFFKNSIPTPVQRARKQLVETLDALNSDVGKKTLTQMLTVVQDIVLQTCHRIDLDPDHSLQCLGSVDSGVAMV